MKEHTPSEAVCIGMAFLGLAMEIGFGQAGMLGPALLGALVMGAWVAYFAATYGWPYGQGADPWR